MSQRFSQSCENNRVPILEQLKRYLSQATSLLEIGSGTGQHAVYFAPELPHLHWHTSDMEVNHDSIIAWQQSYPSSNISAPVAFEIGKHNWPDVAIDAVYTANTAHIMQPEDVKEMMLLIASNMPAGGVFCQYGPFKQDGKFSSDSNESFDAHLRMEGYGGYRDIEELEAWVKDANLKLEEIVSMPANNLMLVWRQQ